jgi:hypothetical protein
MPDINFANYDTQEREAVKNVMIRTGFDYGSAKLEYLKK